MTSSAQKSAEIELALSSTITFLDGHKMPRLGFGKSWNVSTLKSSWITLYNTGTYELDGDEAYQSVRWALEAGYRLIDSAEWYGNENNVGEAIRDFCEATKAPRSEIFYTGKLKINSDYVQAKQSIKRSINDCGLGYFDLYLMHSPIGGKRARQASWKAICDAQKAGLIRSIGISNFGIPHMQDILEMSSEYPKPVVHQIDSHPFMTRTEIVDFSRENGMVLEAWGPLVRGMRSNHRTLRSIAKKYKKNVTHILLRYSLQKGYIAIPKSSHRDRIIANTEIFDFKLTSDEIAQLDALDESLVTDWDPTTVP